MIVEVTGLKRTFTRGKQPVYALRGVDFGLAKGQFTAVMGPSGSGKSTLLHLIGGLDRATTGAVKIEGQDIGKFNDFGLSLFRRKKLGFIFQFFNLLPTMTAVENVALPLLLDGQKMKTIQPRAEALLEMMGLKERMDHTPDQLSGGEMQRVAIARALVTDPVLILADEPTGNLDSKTGSAVLELLSKLAREQHQTILMVTHDSRAASYASRLINMRDGVIETDGTTEKLKNFSGASPLA